ncbi:MAG: ATP-binding cassette domain-containing protein [Clostridiales bacterium]
MNNILETLNLTKKYNTCTAVNNLSFQIKEGEIFGLLGPNGAGKSTTIECILGTKKLTTGSISLFNKNLNGHNKNIFNKIGVQFQSSHYPVMSKFII